MPALLALEVNAMFKNTIVTTDPKTGQPLSVPPELLNGVRRASEILESELTEVSEKFDIAATWRFRPEANGQIEVELDLAGEAYQAVEIQSWVFPTEVFQSDEAIRRALPPLFVKFGLKLSNLVGVGRKQLREELRQFQEELRRDRESLVATSEE
jgi:hypothetical protein